MIIENKVLIKIMWTPNNEIIWDMKHETFNSKRQQEIFSELSKFLDVNKWIYDYKHQYKKWLNDEISDLHKLNSKINQEMIQAINKLGQFNIFYWFDIDRDLYPDYDWSNNDLNIDVESLDDNYPSVNRYINKNLKLVFPK